MSKEGRVEGKEGERKEEERAGRNRAGFVGKTSRRSSQPTRK